MKKITKGIFILFISITFLILSACKENITIDNKTASIAKFVNFTDLHFNPFYDSLLVKTLNESEVELWDSIFNTNPHKIVSHYHEETNYYLLKTALQSMQKELTNPDFIIMTGDYICHDFGENYSKYAQSNNQDDMHKFLLKTITYITQQMQKTFPNTLIIPTFGNNDSYCGDYHLQNEGAFLHDFSKLYQAILGSQLSDDEAMNLEKHGYYCIKNPSNGSHKIIALNSIYFSFKYQTDGAPWNCDCDPNLAIQDSIAQQQFQWLENHLAESKANNEKVWIITHIPPGVNVYKTMKNKEEKKASLFWKESYNKKYLSLLEEYSSEVFTTMTGHTHMDDFKLHISDSSKSYIHISPSISPIFGNNPAFQLIEYDIESADFTNFTKFNINIAETQKASWEKEYNFKDIYPINTLDAEGYNNLFDTLNTDSTYRSSYSRIYESGSENGKEIMDNWNWYSCGISSTLPEVYENCIDKE